MVDLRTSHDDEDDAHDGGLAVDLLHLVDRRRAFKLIAGFGLLTVAACRNADDTSAAPTAPTSAGASPTGSGTTNASGDCAEIPEETGGPFPGDGSNGPNILTQSGVVRSDITSSIGEASGKAEGVPLTIKLTVLSLADGCKPLEGAAVYVWHCDREGGYSMYSQAVANENYLRGVQAADADGKLQFASIFPAAYQGRWPHIHFEVYPDLDSAASASGKLATSQLALPKEACDECYATAGYEQSIGNMQRTSLDSDNVFSDGYSAQLAKMSGDASSGFTAELTVAV
jgi:protocatechuate 3,4-dioxygenase beta subunit